MTALAAMGEYLAREFETVEAFQAGVNEQSECGFALHSWNIEHLLAANAHDLETRVVAVFVKPNDRALASRRLAVAIEMLQENPKAWTDLLERFKKILPMWLR